MSAFWPVPDFRLKVLYNNFFLRTKQLLILPHSALFLMWKFNILGLKWILSLSLIPPCTGCQCCHCRVHFCMLCYYPTHFLYLSFNTAINSSARQMSAVLSPALSETPTMHFEGCKSMWERATYFQQGPLSLHLTDDSSSLALCWFALELHTSCFSISNQYLSTEQEERRRPQTGQEDRKTG